MSTNGWPEVIATAKLVLDDAWESGNEDRIRQAKEGFMSAVQQAAATVSKDVGAQIKAYLTQRGFTVHVRSQTQELPHE